MTRLKLTVTKEYEADPKHYGGEEDPARMALCDLRSFKVSDDALIDVLFNDPDGEFKITVEPVK